MNWRSLPHPEYGNYGGANNHGKNHTLLPIDHLDAIFKIHDIEVTNATKINKLRADLDLFKNLLKINLFSIKIPIYGHFYWLSCLFIFGIINIVYKNKVN